MEQELAAEVHGLVSLLYWCHQLVCLLKEVHEHMINWCGNTQQGIQECGGTAHFPIEVKCRVLHYCRDKK